MAVWRILAVNTVKDFKDQELMERILDERWKMHTPLFVCRGTNPLFFLPSTLLLLLPVWEPCLFQVLSACFGFGLALLLSEQNH